MVQPFGEYKIEQPSVSLRVCLERKFDWMQNHNLIFNIL